MEEGYIQTKPVDTDKKNELTQNKRTKTEYMFSTDRRNYEGSAVTNK